MKTEKLRSLWQKIKQCWKPTPLDPPKVDPEIEHLQPIQRSAESIRYSILSLEFWLSPKGQVREWLRHNMKIAIVLAAPVVLIVPLITYVLVQFCLWVGLLASILGGFLIVPILIFLVLLIIKGIGSIIRCIFGCN